MPNEKQDTPPLAEVLGMLRSLAHDMRTNSEKLVAVENSQHTMERKLDGILDAFPPPVNGVGSGLFEHRAYHIKKNAECKENKETRAMLKRNILLWGAIAILGVLALGVWLVFLSKLPHA